VPNFVNFFSALSPVPSFYCSFLCAFAHAVLVISTFCGAFRQSAACHSHFFSVSPHRLLSPFFLATFVTWNGQYHLVESPDWISYCRERNCIPKEFDWFDDGSKGSSDGENLCGIWEPTFATIITRRVAEERRGLYTHIHSCMWFIFKSIKIVRLELSQLRIAPKVRLLRRAAETEHRSRGIIFFH